MRISLVSSSPWRNAVTPSSQGSMLCWPRKKLAEKDEHHREEIAFYRAEMAEKDEHHRLELASYRADITRLQGLLEASHERYRIDLEKARGSTTRVCSIVRDILICVLLVALC